MCLPFGDLLHRQYRGRRCQPCLDRVGLDLGCCREGPAGSLENGGIQIGCAEVDYTLEHVAAQCKILNASREGVASSALLTSKSRILLDLSPELPALKSSQRMLLCPGMPAHWPLWQVFGKLSVGAQRRDSALGILRERDLRIR